MRKYHHSQVKASSQNLSLLILKRITIMLVVICTPVVTSKEDRTGVTWWNISKFLREFTNNGLRANELQEKLESTYIWSQREVNGQERLDEINRKVSRILEWNIEIVQRLKRVIEKEYDTWPEYNQSEVNVSALCCKTDPQNLSPDGCALLPSPEPKEPAPVRAVIPPQAIIRELKKSQNLLGQRVAQYFAFNDGSLFMYPSWQNNDLSACKSYDPRLRYFFTQSKSPEAREVVLVVDRLMNSDSDFLLKVVERILKALSPIDRMALCLPENDKCRNSRVGEASWPRQDHPLGTQSFYGVTVASSENNKKLIIKLLKKWISKTSVNIKKNSVNHVDEFTSHVAALIAGDELFQSSNNYQNVYNAYEYHRVLVYVTTRGGLPDWHIHEKLVEQLNRTITNNIHVVIHPVQDAAAELRDEVIMYNDNSNHNITVKMSPFVNETQLYASPTSIASFGLSVPDRPVIPMPYWDAFGMGYIMSVCLPLTKDTLFLGSVCTDVSIVNLVETGTDVNDIDDAYVFIVNSLGYTLMHPMLPSPYSIQQDPIYVSIKSLEQAQEVQPFLNKIVRQQPGTEDVHGMQMQPIGRPRRSGVPSPVKLLRQHLRYQWVPINNTDLTITLVLPLHDGKVLSSEYKCNNVSSCNAKHFRYHLPKPTENRTVCKFFGTEVTENTGLVKFAPNCFVDVLSYVQDETPSDIEKIYDIFSSHIPHDELLRRDFRGSVHLLETAEELWRMQLQQDPNLNDDIGARYMGTADGVFISFPGTTLQQIYDHRERPWYLRAISNPKKVSITMTTPYCDEWGAGMVYSITKALYDPLGNPVAVVSGDITFQYVMNNFHTQVSHCKSHTCLLVDRMGYVVLKSDWSTINTFRKECTSYTDIQVAHLNRLAPDIARDMISQGILMRWACHDYEQDLTFYYWTLSLSGHSTMYVGPSYNIHKIPQTSLYLIVRTKEFSRDICNCNPFLKGEAVKCHDTCALECECPCVAGPETQPCHNPDADVHRHPVPPCKPRGLRAVRAKNSTTPDLKPCEQHRHSCSSKNESDCRNVGVCHWSGKKCRHLDDI